jgi:beta propeller repeat protein
MKVDQQFHRAFTMMFLLSILITANMCAAETGVHYLNNTTGFVIGINDIQKNTPTANQTIPSTPSSGNETPFINGSTTIGVISPAPGHETGINNSFQENNGTHISPGNVTVEKKESAKDSKGPIIDNSSEIPVSYSGLETGSMTLISTSSLSDNYQPKIEGENIVWFRLDPVNQTSGIVLYNISTGNEIPLTLPGHLDTVNPAVSGDYVVYSGQAPDDPVYRIYLYEIDTASTSLLTSPDDPVYRILPAISGNNVVWSEFDAGHGRIVLHNLITNSSLVISPNSELLDNSYPSISGDYVVWQAMDIPNSTYSVWLHQITTNITVSITPPGQSSSQQAPAISGDRIVYADGIGGEWDIMEYNISSRESHKISLQKIVNNNPQIAIDGKLVAWADKSEGYGNIYLFDRLNRTVSLLTPADSNYSSKTAPSISGDRIVWECNNLGKIDIHMFTRGPPADDLIADFSINQTIGKSPLVVNFKDKSPGSPTAWNWDFGDGVKGTGQEEIHTYTNPGLYSVTLTVSNQFYRNSTRKFDLINVATPPEAGFSTDISSGPSPLNVQFVDLSTGSPVNWSWDFGDGEFANISSPVHTYQDPGIYSPRLLVANDFGNTTIVKENLIIVLPASHSTSTAGLDGLEVFEKDGGKSIVLNITGFGGSFFISPDNQILTLNPSTASWIKDINLYSGSGGFTSKPDGFIVGNISGLEVTTRDIQGGNPGSTVIPGSNLNLTVNLQSIPLTGQLNTISWDGITSDDLIAFSQAINYAGFVGITGSAYSVQITSSGIEPANNVTLHFSVNSSWVEEKGGRESVYVLRKANDGGLEVLPTTFLGNNSDENMDYFKADSPHGLSTFVISSLHGSGNPLQLFYLSVSTRIAPPANAGGGGGGGGGGSYGGSGNQVTSTSQPESTGSQSGTAKDGSPADNTQGQNGQSNSLSSESASLREAPVNPVAQVSNAPAANPPLLPPQPTNSIFSMLIEAAAMVSVILIVVFSVSLRYRQREKE